MWCVDVGMSIAHPLADDRWSRSNLWCNVVGAATCRPRADNIRPYRFYPRSVRRRVFGFVKTLLYQTWVKRRFFTLKNAPKRRFSDTGRLRRRKTKKICRKRLKTIEKISFICYNNYIWGNVPFCRKPPLSAEIFPSFFGDFLHQKNDT